MSTRTIILLVISAVIVIGGILVLSGKSATPPNFPPETQEDTASQVK